MPADWIDEYGEQKTRQIILTDAQVGSDPDDKQSLVRALLYSNDVQIEGLIAQTSTWLHKLSHEGEIRAVIDAYEKVQPSLLKHDSAFPTAKYLRSIECARHDGIEILDPDGHRVCFGEEAA